MGCNPAEVAQVSGKSPGVYISICNELRKLMDKTSDLIPAIESARPGSMLGMMELCSLNNSIEKAKQLIEHFSESSKLYLVITGDASVKRCQRLQNMVEKSLTHIQTMVPEPLASQILNAIDFLGDIKFMIDPPEEEARKALLSLLRQNDSTEISELKTFQLAASKLHLTSSKALLVERRCVKKLLDKFSGSDSKKERILNYLMHLLTTYGKKHQCGVYGSKESDSAVVAEKQENPDSSGEVNLETSMQMPSYLDTSVAGTQQEILPENDITSDSCSGSFIPEKFCCPITSRLMYDPVVVASGQTFERIHIEKWFSDGHNTCPKTQVKLSNLTITPNVNLKMLISQWCQSNGISLQEPYLQSNIKPVYSWDTLNSSSTSFNSVSEVVLDNRNENYIFHSNYRNLSDLSSKSSWNHESTYTKDHLKSTEISHTHYFIWSDDYQKYHSFSEFNFELFTKFLSELSQLPLDVHCKALEDLKVLLHNDEETYLMFSNGFVDSLVMFLKDAYDSSNIIAQKSGSQILLDFLKYSRIDIPSLNDKACSLLECFLDTENINLEALKIIRAFCSYQRCKSTVAASGVLRPVINILGSEDRKLLEVAVEILHLLSSIVDATMHISSPVCLVKLSSSIREQQFSGICLKILQNLCKSKEGLTAIANGDGCISSIVEHLEYDNKEEQSFAVSLLLCLCSSNPENCDLVLKEGIIPSLVDISVNGNPQGKRDSRKLLQILRDLKHNHNLECSDKISEPATHLPSNIELQHPADLHYENENLKGNHVDLQSSAPSVGSFAESPKGCKNHRKTIQTHKSSKFGIKFSIFSKH